jgi:H+/Cl- antiporter ClcA
MKGLSIITGGLVGLAAPVLVVGATVGANVLSISRDALRATKQKVSRKRRSRAQIIHRDRYRSG